MENKKPLSQEEILAHLDNLPDEVISHIACSMPWQVAAPATSRPVKDEDGFTINTDVSEKKFDRQQIKDLQEKCWLKFCSNPQVNSSIRDMMGRVTGAGFEISSNIYEVQEALEELIEDPRNDLYTNLSKYFARSEIEGELFLVLTLHSSGFVEIDFRDPSTVGGWEQDEYSGIVVHPDKPQMHIGYLFDLGNDKREVIPSINVAYYPDSLKPLLLKNKSVKQEYLKGSATRKNKFRSIGGFRRFVVSWNKGYLTLRNISHLRTTLEWLNYYENLKKYEIDHKKSSGAYLWIAKFEDPKFFRQWLALSDTDRAKTGLMAIKTPGGTLILPPGLNIECKNPNLSKISDTDTDIMEMAVSGLNMPSDMVTGSSKGTFASVKASRAPQSDRTADSICFLERFLKYHLFRGCFFLKSAVSDFPKEFSVEEVVGFKKSGSFDPIKKTVKKAAFKFVDFSFPVSEVTDLEARARALLGVKHGSIVDTLGIPRECIAKSLGFGSYKRLRLQHATEDETLPELISTLDSESVQETKEAEPPVKKNKPLKKNSTK